MNIHSKTSGLPACLGAILLAVAAAGARGESAVDTRAIDAVFAEWNRWDSPGAALAVVCDGKVIYERGYGNAHLEYPIPITPSTIFHVASVSKQFTCFAIVLLAQEGKLTLDDDIRRHLSDLPDFGHTITIRHLMHHTSGLRDQWELLAMGGWRLDDVITRDHIMKMVRRQRELNFEPGAEHLYSNTGYTLLAEIVAKASGQPFTAFTRQRIFEPLAMSSTHFHDDHEMIVPGRAYSYSKGPIGGYRKSVLSYANVGATSLFTTAEDLCRWLTNLDDGRVGGEEAIKLMHERGVLANGKTIDYALGLAHSKHRGLEIVGHSGGDAAFRAHVLRVPKHKLGIAVLSNLGSFNPGRAAHQVADILLAEHLSAPAEGSAQPEAVQVDRAILERYAGVYRLNIGPLVKLTVAGKDLVGDIAGAPRFKLIARSKNEFFAKELNAKIVFEVADGKPATGFKGLIEGQELRGTRLVETAPTDPGALVGVYYSRELETTYTIELKNGGLVARHQRHPDITLKALGGDEFAGSQWFFGTVRFERDGNGRASGLRASGGRVRNMRFERREEKPAAQTETKPQ